MGLCRLVLNFCQIIPMCHLGVGVDICIWSLGIIVVYWCLLSFKSKSSCSWYDCWFSIETWTSGVLWDSRSFLNFTLLEGFFSHCSQGRHHFLTGGGSQHRRREEAFFVLLGGNRSSVSPTGSLLLLSWLKGQGRHLVTVPGHLPMSWVSSLLLSSGRSPDFPPGFLWHPPVRRGRGTSLSPGSASPYLRDESPNSLPFVTPLCRGGRALSQPVEVEI